MRSITIIDAYGILQRTSANGSYLVYNFANSNLGIASIGIVKIPTSVEKAKIKAKNCDIFIIEKGAWISAAGFGQAVNIH